MVCVSTVTFIIGTNSEGEREKRERLADIEHDEAGNIAESSNINITEVIDNIAVIFLVSNILWGKLTNSIEKYEIKIVPESQSQAQFYPNIGHSI